MISEHVLLGHAGSILDAQARLSPQLDGGAIEEIVALVPPEWFVGDGPEIYSEYLIRRVQNGAFAEEAERARRGA
jgi:hypothetical protein